jgi:hypothetical protein
MHRERLHQIREIKRLLPEAPGPSQVDVQSSQVCALRRAHCELWLEEDVPARMHALAPPRSAGAPAPLTSRAADPTRR